MLLALCTGFRLQSLALLTLEGIKINTASVELRVSDLVKTSRPGATQPYALLPFFTARPNICCAKILICYINCTKDLRADVKQ